MLVVLLAIGTTLAAACADAEHDLGVVGPVEGGPRVFVGEDGSAADAAGPAIAYCIGTECPPPWATCVSPSGPSYKCGTDLDRDPSNCGACGTVCPPFYALNMTSRCVSGACELECVNQTSDTQWHDCNSLVDDGCETDVFADANSCGSCGNACPTGQPCIKGVCGCPGGTTFCAGSCVDLKTSDANCGGCGVVCDAPGACADPPPNSYFGCFGGTCGKLKCAGLAADCDNDVGLRGCASDGCEVPDVVHDAKNCGGCGITCNASKGEVCLDEGAGPECAVPCARFGQSKCGDGCADFLTNVNNCGSCGNVCPTAGDNEERTCAKGLCAFACADGFADCNGDRSDGCETDLRSNPASCGACGATCDLGAGQPCVEGKCLLTPCNPEQTK